LKGDDGEDYFAHVTALLDGQSLETDARVEFELATNLRNKRIHAAQARVVG
jgi:cold shock CspA family protein